MFWIALVKLLASAAVLWLAKAVEVLMRHREKTDSVLLEKLATSARELGCSVRFLLAAAHVAIWLVPTIFIVVAIWL